MTVAIHAASGHVVGRGDVERDGAAGGVEPDAVIDGGVGRHLVGRRKVLRPHHLHPRINDQRPAVNVVPVDENPADVTRDAGIAPDVALEFRPVLGVAAPDAAAFDPFVVTVDGLAVPGFVVAGRLIIQAVADDVVRLRLDEGAGDEVVVVGVIRTVAGADDLLPVGGRAKAVGFGLPPQFAGARGDAAAVAVLDGAVRHALRAGLGAGPRDGAVEPCGRRCFGFGD
jgi:hypothetical protein